MATQDDGGYGAPGANTVLDTVVASAAGQYGAPSEVSQYNTAPPKAPALPGSAVGETANLGKQDHEKGGGLLRSKKLVWIAVGVLALMVVYLFAKKR